MQEASARNEQLARANKESEEQLKALQSLSEGQDQEVRDQLQSLVS